MRESFCGRHVLISGGLGFIGSNLARALVEFGADVTLVDSLVPEYGGNLFNIAGIEDRLRINISDVRDEHSMSYLVQGKDLLFNLAGQTSHADSMQDPFTDLDINCRAQLSILEACRKYNPRIRIVFASTRQVYGKPDYLPVDEDHLLRPTDVNGINKMAGEWYHVLYSNVYGIRSSSLRLTNTIGPHMRVKDSRQTFLGTWIRLLIQGEPFEVWGGSQLRDFTYVDDAVRALLLVATSENTCGQVYNVGGDCIISLKGLADLFIEVSGTGAYRICSFPPERERIDIGDYYADDRKLRNAIAWQPEVPLREALARTIAFYRRNLQHYL